MKPNKASKDDNLRSEYPVLCLICVCVVLLYHNGLGRRRTLLFARASRRVPTTGAPKFFFFKNFSMQKMFNTILNQDANELIHQHVAAMIIQKHWDNMLDRHEALIEVALQIEVWYDQYSRGIMITHHNLHILKFVYSRLLNYPLIQYIMVVWNKLILLPIRCGLIAALRENEQGETHILLSHFVTLYTRLGILCQQRMGKRLRKILRTDPFFSVSMIPIY